MERRGRGGASERAREAQAVAKAATRHAPLDPEARCGKESLWLRIAFGPHGSEVLLKCTCFVSVVVLGDQYEGYSVEHRSPVTAGHDPRTTPAP